MKSAVGAIGALLLWTAAALAADFTVTGLSPGQSVVSNIQVMAVPVAGTTAQNVTFTLINAAGATVSNNQEYAVPYCFVGDLGALPCTPYNTATVPDGAYTLRVVMQSTAGAISKTIPFTIANNASALLPGKPSAPVLVQRNAADWSLFWNNNSSTQTSIEVERGPAVGGPFAQIAILPGDKDTHVDRDVTMTGSYCYRIRALQGTTPSPYSNVACTP